MTPASGEASDDRPHPAEAAADSTPHSSVAEEALAAFRHVTTRSTHLDLNDLLRSPGVDVRPEVSLLEDDSGQLGVSMVTLQGGADGEDSKSTTRSRPHSTDVSTHRPPTGVSAAVSRRSADSASGSSSSSQGDSAANAKRPTPPRLPLLSKTNTSEAKHDHSATRTPRQSTASPRNPTPPRSGSWPEGTAMSGPLRCDGVKSERTASQRPSEESASESDPITSISRLKSNSIRYADLFSLPHNQQLLDRFSCGLLRGIIFQGTLYLFTNFVCFRSIVFGVTVLVMPAKDITQVRRERYLLIDNAIRFTLADGNSHLFVSFSFPSRAFQRMEEAGCLSATVFEHRDNERASPRWPHGKARSEGVTSSSSISIAVPPGGSTRGHRLTPDSPTAASHASSGEEDEDEEDADYGEETRQMFEDSMAVCLFATGRVPCPPRPRKHLLHVKPGDMTEVLRVTLPCNNTRVFRALFLDSDEEAALVQQLHQAGEKRSGPDGARDSPASPNPTTPASEPAMDAPEAVGSSFSARHNFFRFQTRLGHRDFELDKWHLDEEYGIVREFRYRKPLPPAPMSPRETRMTETMAFYGCREGGSKACTLSVEVRGKSHDVPFADSFLAEQRYVFSPSMDNGKYECEVVIYGATHLEYRSMFSGTIQRKTLDGIRHTAEVLVGVLRELCTTSLRGVPRRAQAIAGGEAESARKRVRHDEAVEASAVPAEEPPSTSLAVSGLLATLPFWPRLLHPTIQLLETLRDTLVDFLTDGAKTELTVEAVLDDAALDSRQSVRDDSAVATPAIADADDTNVGSRGSAERPADRSGQPVAPDALTMDELPRALAVLLRPLYQGVSVLNLSTYVEASLLTTILLLLVLVLLIWLTYMHVQVSRLTAEVGRADGEIVLLKHALQTMGM
ncbi:hypothetical protein CDCA_CDCA10G3055 [Cyanidium caldarium]|uniref:VASt domain-containing protein n=1 Tax=Cyanidium caldarium TaxID=2771 RepID=A0AAV9IY64_CYACA|nr:hypothetical protein CDCA_CDCA10G3055 [Cyanidium caldarium]